MDAFGAVLDGAARIIVPDTESIGDHDLNVEGRGEFIENRLSGLGREKQRPLNHESLGNLFEIFKGADFGNVDDPFEFADAFLVLAICLDT